MPASARQVGILCAVLSTALSSIAIVFQASATKLIDPLLLGGVANIVGGLLVGCFVFGRGAFPSTAVLRANARDLVWLAFLRAFLGAILFWWGLSLTLGVKAMFFTKAEPYFILAWDWLFERRRIPKHHAALLLVHVCGAILLSTGSFSGFNATQLGDVLLVLAVAVLGLSYRFGARLSVNLGAFPTISVSQLLGGCLLLPIGLYSSGGEFHFEADLAWKYFLFSILLWNVLGASFWLFALKEVDTWVVSALRALGPLIAAPVAWLYFDEILSPIQLLGGALVLFTSFLIARENRSKIGSRT